MPLEHAPRTCPKNMPLSWSAEVGMGCSTSQCSTILPSSSSRMDPEVQGARTHGPKLDSTLRQFGAHHINEHHGALPAPCALLLGVHILQVQSVSLGRDRSCARKTFEPTPVSSVSYSSHFYLSVRRQLRLGPRRGQSRTLDRLSSTTGKRRGQARARTSKGMTPTHGCVPTRTAAP
jgi:hypothetical protein